MSGKAKNPPMLPGEIDAMNESLVCENHLYSRDIDASEKMRNVIVRATAGIKREPISLENTAAVQMTAEAYIASCIRTPILPTRSGLSLALGYSRVGLLYFMRRNPGHQTTVFLQRLFDSFSEALDHAALAGITNNVYSIFVQKSVYGRVDNPQTDIVEEVKLEQSAEEIMAKYADLPDTTDDTEDG